MALLDELIHVPARQGALEEHHDVLDHVLVRNVLQERRQRLLRLRLEEVELHHLIEEHKRRNRNEAYQVPGTQKYKNERQSVRKCKARLGINTNLTEEAQLKRTIPGT